MFLTTIRVRRLRAATMRKHNLHLGSLDVVEVMAHGAVLAIVQVPADRALRNSDVLWAHGTIKHDPKGICQAVAGAVALMGAVHEHVAELTPA